MAEIGKTVTVTGATGTLGRAVVDRLLAGGVAVRGLSRNPPADRRAGLEWVLCDLSAESGMDEAFAGTGTVIHCATNSRRPKQDVAGARNLIAALDAEQVPVICVSIVGADRIPLGYYRIKLEVENLIRESGLPWTIQRATQFHDLIATGLRALSFSPLLPVPANTSFQPVAVEDLAGRLVELVDSPGGGRVPDFGGPEVLAAGRLARIWLEATNRRRRVIPLKLPGGVAAGFRAGHNLAPEHRDGSRTFTDFLTGPSGG